MIAERDALDLIEGLERSARRSRPFVLTGLVAMLIGFGTLVYYLEMQRREAEARAEQAETLVRYLQKARASGDRSRWLGKALVEARDLSSSLAESGGAAAAEPTPDPPRLRTQPRPAPAPKPPPEPAEQRPVVTASRATVRAAAPDVTAYYVVRQDVFDRLAQDPQVLSQQIRTGPFGPFPLGAVIGPVRPGAVYVIIPQCGGRPNFERRQMVPGERLGQTALSCS